MFTDEITLELHAGRGGDGCVSFHSEPFKPKGGPDGGNGGRGGDVVFVARDDCSSLVDIASWRVVKAKNGVPGKGGNCFGKNGEDKVIRVPVGTMIFDAESDELLADLVEPGAEYLAVNGGKGGRGNKAFASATHQVPHDFEFGREGQTRTVRVELKLIADVGLVGYPNAGKSTLLSRCSAARPKIANYPFTTLEPQLGIVERGFRRFVMADIPGLIEGASAGKGLGHQFLKHIERTRLILHMIDLSAGEVEELTASYHTIRRELENFSDKLGGELEIVVGNKIDVTESRERLDELAEALGVKVWPLSGVSGEGLEDLLREVTARLDALDEAGEVAKAQAAREERANEGEGDDEQAEKPKRWRP